MQKRSFRFLQEEIWNRVSNIYISRIIRDTTDFQLNNPVYKDSQVYAGFQILILK